MARAGGSRVRRLFARAASADNLRQVILRGMGGILLTIGSAISAGILTIADVILVPLSVMIDVSAALATAIFGGAARVINFGALSSAVAIGPNGAFNVGPLGLPLGVGIVLLTLYIMVAYLSEEPTGNFFPGIPFDIPTPGFTGPEEDDEDS